MLPSSEGSIREVWLLCKNPRSVRLGRENNVGKDTDTGNGMVGLLELQLPEACVGHSWLHTWEASCRSSQQEEVPEWKALLPVVIGCLPSVLCVLASVFPTIDRPPSWGRHLWQPPFSSPVKGELLLLHPSLSFREGL